MQNIQSKQIVTTAPTLIVPKAANGQCGSSNASIISSAPSSFLCSSGNPSGVTPSTQSNGTTIYTWNCAGTYGGATTSCMATQRIDPKCGAANGIVAQSAPTTNLCSVGTASGVILNGQTFNWTCNGNVFNDTQCSASYNPPTPQPMSKIIRKGCVYSNDGYSVLQGEESFTITLIPINSQIGYLLPAGVGNLYNRKLFSQLEDSSFRKIGNVLLEYPATSGNMYYKGSQIFKIVDFNRVAVYDLTITVLR